MKVRVVPVTAENFSPYGQLIVASETYGRQSFSAALSHDHRPVALSTTHVRAVQLPITIEQIERHPFSSQTFVPMEVSRWVVVVSVSPELSDLRGFMIGPGVGVTIGRGIWHYQLTALDADAKFVVLMWKDHSTDEEIISIPPVELAAPSN
jgi:ureidoglycolate lyase|tara:strand:- start:387 stop:839 length:453 start_codon:yes stop_codon:yes gene_type:complete